MYVVPLPKRQYIFVERVTLTIYVFDIIHGLRSSFFRSFRISLFRSAINVDVRHVLERVVAKEQYPGQPCDVVTRCVYGIGRYIMLFSIGIVSHGLSDLTFVGPRCFAVLVRT